MPISIGFDAYISRNGVISIFEIKFEAPFIFIVTNLFPSPVPFKPAYNFVIFSFSLEIALPLPFDIVLPHKKDEPILCAEVESCNGCYYNREIPDRYYTNTISASIHPSRKFPNTLVFRISSSGASLMPTTVSSWRGLLESVLYAWPHCDATVSISGKVVYKRGGHHIIVDLRDIVLPRQAKSVTRDVTIGTGMIFVIILRPIYRLINLLGRTVDEIDDAVVVPMFNFHISAIKALARLYSTSRRCRSTWAASPRNPKETGTFGRMRMSSPGQGQIGR